MEFRLLRVDEIDCRISMVQSWGIGLLLYKDARCDQNILDETVGPMNWQRHHLRDNANCIVSIWDENKQQWIEKEDTGTESYTEREKGLASDSFKRACFNWGIGRELYTSPSMFIGEKDLDSIKNDGGRWVCKDRFKVTEIEYYGRKIAFVEILNEKTGKTMTFGDTTPIGKAKAKELEQKCDAEGVDYAKVCAMTKVSRFEDITVQNYAILESGWENWKVRCKKDE